MKKSTRAIRAFNRNYADPFREARREGKRAAQEARGAVLTREFEALRRKYRGREESEVTKAVKKFFAKKMAEGVTAEELEAMVRAAKREGRVKRMAGDEADFHQDQAPGPKPREDEEDEESEGLDPRDEDDEDGDDEDDEAEESEDEEDEDE